MDPHRISLFSKIHNHQTENSQKPLFLTPPQPRHSEKLSAVPIFGNGLQRPFAPIRSTLLAEKTTKDLDSHAPPGSPSLQRSSTFCDNKGEPLRHPKAEVKDDHDKARNTQFGLLGNHSFQNTPVDHPQFSLNTEEKLCPQSSIGLLENDMSEDLILSKMASNHRQAKIELMKLREQHADLQSQFNIKTKFIADLSRQNAKLSHQVSDTSHQNSELSRRFAQLKSVSKEAIDKANKSCTELRDAYEVLRIQSQASSTLVNDARQTMESLGELRDAARTGFQLFLDDAGNLRQIGETKAVVNELQAELDRTQQVADLLREKLQNMGSELLDTRSRVTELEEYFGNDRKLITSTASELQRTSERVTDTIEDLKVQKSEVIDAIGKLANAEDRLAYNQSRMQERDAMIHSMRQEVDSMRQEISEFKEALNDRKAQIRILQNTISFQEQHMKDLEERLQKAEEESALAHDSARDFEARLEASKDLEKTLVQQNTRLTSEGESIRERTQIAEARLTDIQNEAVTLSVQNARLVLERDILLDKLKVTDMQIADAKQEEESHRERFAEARTSLKVLQDRFDDQSVTLGLTKERFGETQDRLHSANDTILALKEDLAKSNHRISVLEERERSLQLRLDEANVTITTERDLVSGLRKDLLECQINLSQQEGSQQATQQIAEKYAREAEQRIRELESKTSALCGELDEKQQVIFGLTQRLTVAEAPSNQQEQELIILKKRVLELEQSEKQLLQRASNITVRHEQSDLNDNEWLLVQRLARQAREAFECELVEKNNDIRRRDNLIKHHEARITQLEASLARRIGETPQVRSSTDDKEDETFWSEPPSGHRKQSARETTKRSVITGPQHADGTFQENGDSGSGDFECEKTHVAHIKRTISREDEELARPARRPKNSKHPDMEKITDKVPGPSKKTNKRQNR